METARRDGPDVITVGESMTLLLADGPTPLERAERLELGVAGAESNVAIGLSRLGHRTEYFGRLGDDVFGRRIRQELRGEGIDVTGLILDPEHPTGLLFRDAPAARPISVVYRRSDSAACFLRTTDVPDDRIRQARLLHLTGITAALSPSSFDALVHAAEVAREAGVTVSFDPNVRARLAGPEAWQRIADTFGRLADVVFTGADEAETIAPGTDPVDYYQSRGASTVIIKDGEHGSVEISDGERRQGAIHPVTSVDTVGAGDAFNVGWISAWLRGADAPTRLREAAVVAALVVAERGDTPGLPDAATRDRVLAAESDIDR